MKNHLIIISVILVRTEGKIQQSNSKPFNEKSRKQYSSHFQLKKYVRFIAGFFFQLHHFKPISQVFPIRDLLNSYSLNTSLTLLRINKSGRISKRSENSFLFSIRRHKSADGRFNTVIKDGVYKAAPCLKRSITHVVSSFVIIQ